MSANAPVLDPVDDLEASWLLEKTPTCHVKSAMPGEVGRYLCGKGSGERHAVGCPVTADFCPTCGRKLCPECVRLWRA